MRMASAKPLTVSTWPSGDDSEDSDSCDHVADHDGDARDDGEAGHVALRILALGGIGREQLHAEGVEDDDRAEACQLGRRRHPGSKAQIGSRHATVRSREDNGKDDEQRDERDDDGAAVGRDAGRQALGVDAAGAGGCDEGNDDGHGDGRRHCRPEVGSCDADHGDVDGRQAEDVVHPVPPAGERSGQIAEGLRDPHRDAAGLRIGRAELGHVEDGRNDEQECHDDPASQARDPEGCRLGNGVQDHEARDAEHDHRAERDLLPSHVCFLSLAPCKAMSARPLRALPSKHSRRARPAIPWAGGLPLWARTYS